MKLQDHYPFDSAIVGLDGIYTTVGDDSFLINSNCIITKDHIITTGHTYLFVISSLDAGLQLHAVDIIDVYYYEGTVYLILQYLTAEKFTIDLFIECPEFSELPPCNWMLIDLNYLSNKFEKDIINV